MRDHLRSESDSPRTGSGDLKVVQDNLKSVSDDRIAEYISVNFVLDNYHRSWWAGLAKFTMSQYTLWCLGRQ